MSLLSPRRHLIALLLVATLPAIAFADDAAIDKGFAIMGETDDEETFYRAAQDIAALGPEIVPNLTRRLIEAETDDQRIDLTYLLAVILDQAKFAGKTVELPPELMPEIAALMKQPSELTVQANLANLARHFVPQPPEITEGLLSILSRAEHEGLRATASATIAMQGSEDVLPLVHDALRSSDSDRYSGDLAAILRGTELPQDIVGILESLLTSDDAEARQTASRVLTEADVRNPAQLDAALRDLDAADTDMQLLNAAMAVREHTDGSERVAEALGTALGQARRGEERREIIRALAASGDAGLDRLYRIIQSTEDPELLAQFILGMNSTAEASDNPRTLEVLMAMVIESEDPDIADAAAFGLNLHGAAAVAAIDAVLADEQTDDTVRARLSPIRDRLAK
ncbi:hypothetical protein [Mesorhizobium sp. CAU 1732]|uniref:hypothetical protein n=1 Tax=Mesorhizobium sp. CAU 1732 TaxID=3140358 RepID=UPI00326103D6